VRKEAIEATLTVSMVNRKLRRDKRRQTAALNYAACMKDRTRRMVNVLCE
jgi:hypothetical protein